MAPRPHALLALLVLLAPAGRAGIAIVGSLTEERVVEPGKSYTGTLRIRNLGETPQAARVYQADYSYSADGTSLYGEPGKVPRSNAAWIALSPTLLTIPPGAEASVTYTIQVPADPSLAGTYWSLIMVEGMGEASPQPLPPSREKAKIGIRQVLRYGIQMVTEVGDTGSRNLKFDTRLLRAEGKRILQIDVSNPGERWLRPFLSVQLFNAEGQLVGKFDGQRARVYPGTSVRRALDLTGVPAGDYRALLVADAGEDNVYGATYTLKLGQ